MPFHERMDMLQMVELSRSVDATQAYFMELASINDREEITVTFKDKPPYVTVFLGKGPNAPIGMGNSVATAILDAMKSQKKQPL